MFRYICERIRNGLGGVVMIKLVLVLTAGMLVVLLIGGEDRGQMRQGLIGVDPVVQPVLRAAIEAPKPAAQADVTLATLPSVTMEQPKRQAAPIAGAFVVMNADKTTANIAPTMPQTVLPMLYVNSTSVNVRGGPSTDYEVVGRLTRAEAVTVVSAAAGGWVHIRIEGDGIEGYVAARLLTETDPAN